METKKWYQNKKAIIGIVAFVIAIVAMVFVYKAMKPQAGQGTKSVTVEVVASDGKQTDYSTKTDAEFLIEVLDELKAQGLTYSGTESEYGMMIDTVNDEKASYEENGSFWSIIVNGEYGNYGVSEQSVNDGDTFGLVYTAG